MQKSVVVNLMGFYQSKAARGKLFAQKLCICDGGTVNEESATNEPSSISLNTRKLKQTGLGQVAQPRFNIRVGSRFWSQGAWTRPRIGDKGLRLEFSQQGFPKFFSSHDSGFSASGSGSVWTEEKKTLLEMPLTVIQQPPPSVCTSA